MDVCEPRNSQIARGYSVGSTKDTSCEAQIEFDWLSFEYLGGSNADFLSYLIRH